MPTIEAIEKRIKRVISAKGFKLVKSKTQLGRYHVTHPEMPKAKFENVSLDELAEKYGVIDRDEKIDRFSRPRWEQVKFEELNETAKMLRILADIMSVEYRYPDMEGIRHGASRAGDAYVNSLEYHDAESIRIRGELVDALKEAMEGKAHLVHSLFAFIRAMNSNNHSKRAALKKG